MADKMTGLGALGQQLIREPSKPMMVDTTTGEGANMFIEEDRRRMGPAGPAGRDDENFTILDPSFDIQIMTHSGVGAPPLLTEMGGKYYVIQDGAFIPFNSREEAEKYIRQVAPFNKGGRVGLRFGTPEEGIGSLNAGAPDITYEGSEGPKAPMQMAGPDRYQKILEFKINELEGELGRDLTDEEYKEVSEEAYEEYHYGAKAPQGIENAVPASYEPGNYDEEDIKAYEQYKYDMEEQRPGMPIMDIDEFLRTERSTVAKGGRIKYNQGGRTGFQTGGVTESRVLPPEYIEALGKTYAADLTKQAGIPSITTAIAQQPGETAQQWQQRQAQAQQYGITKAGMAELAPQVAAQDPYQAAAYAQAVDPTTGLGAYQPFLTKAGTAADAATALTGTGAGTGAGSIASYMSPYQQQVIDATMADYDAQAAKSRLGLGAQAVAGGAFGSGRHGIAEAEFDALSNRGRASQLANLRSTGFQQAAQRRQQDLANQMGISNLQQGLGGQAQDFSRAQIAGLGTLGATQQAQNQAVLDAQRQFATMAVQEPVNRMNMLGTGVMGLMGGMSPYSTRIGEAPATPQSSPLATALGVGLAGADIYSRLFAGKRN
jgi:hypothetical protein